MIDLKDKRIGVLMGGWSREREISLRSGRAVANALRGLGYEVIEIDVGRNLAQNLVAEKIETAFVVLHGRYGEDGTVQGLLEVMGIPYTGSGLAGSAVGIDKEMTKRLVAQAGVRTPDWKTYRQEDLASLKEPPLPLPVIVKPNREGSTIGISIVRETKEFKSAVEQALGHDETVLVEQYVAGTEVTVGILSGKALPVLEVVPKSGFYDYTSKYTKGMTTYIVPARIPDPVARRLSETSEMIFSLMRLSDFARMDFMVAADQNEFFLEVNTIPGMTETSLIPKAAAAVGISFETLCETILKGASLKG